MICRGGQVFPLSLVPPALSAMILNMPNVNGKKYPYTAAGKKAAASAMKKKKTKNAKTKR